MGSIILHIAMSLDGYIAKENQDVSWLEGQEQENTEEGSYPSFIKDVDTIIMGNTTYHQLKTELSPGVWPYKDKETYVVTRQEREQEEDVSFVSDVVSVVKQLKKENKKVWICGGASIVDIMMKEDLIDEYTISVIPTILGEGIPLFKKGETKLLRLVSTTSYNGIVDLVYKRR